MTVEALLLFDGVDGSTTFTDETGNQTWSAGGSGSVAELDNVQSVNGGTSLLTDDGQSISATLLNPISGEFTVEFWAYIPNDATGTIALASIQLGSPYVFELRYDVTTTQFTLSGSYGGATFLSGSYNDSFFPGEWLHFAIYRDANNQIGCRVMGISSATGTSTFYNATYTTGALDVITIGNGSLGSYHFDGWIDSLRVSTDHIYQSGKTGLALPVNPGLTYTVNELGINTNAGIHNPDTLEIGWQIITPINGQNLADSVIFLDPFAEEGDAAGATGGTGIQLWG